MAEQSKAPVQCSTGCGCMQIRQTAKLKSLANKPRIWQALSHTHFSYITVIISLGC